MAKKSRKKTGWHTIVYAGTKTRVHYGKHGKITAKIPLKTLGQGFTKTKRKR